MSIVRRKRFSALVLLLIGVLVVGGLYALPSTLTQLTYAVERGKAYAAKDQLSVATDLSTAFKQVAKAIRPSVVSISSTKRMQPTMRGRGNMSPRIPDDLRRFFGDSPFGDFGFELPIPREGLVQHGLGSGAIVSADGYILTNNHVVDGADDLTVHLSDKREFKAKVIGTDKATDLAVIKINASNLVPARLGDSSAMEVGDWVLAMGSPFGLDQTVTAGIVSAVGRGNVGLADYENFIQTDAAINPGNSGGPLVNLKGEVVGINTAIASRSGGNMGIGFAIPSSMAQSVMSSLIENGKVNRGYLGAIIQDLTPELSASFHFKGTDGVLIGDVDPTGPAGKAGLKAGDIVVRYNGKPVTTMRALRQRVAATKAGNKVKVEVFRGGRYETINVRIAPRKEEVASFGSPSGATSQLGLAVKTLTPEIGSQLGYADEVKGVVVTEVEPGGAASQVGIQPGDVILSVNGTNTFTAPAFLKAVKKTDLSKGVRLQVMRDNVRRFVFLRIQK